MGSTFVLKLLTLMMFYSPLAAHFFTTTIPKPSNAQNMTQEYIEYTEPVINDPGIPQNAIRDPDHPCMSLLTRWQLRGYTWQKILAIIFLIFPLCCVFSVLDFTLWLSKTTLKVFLESFGRKILAYAALFIFVFMTFWLIKSGEWQKLFEFCSKLFS